MNNIAQSIKAVIPPKHRLASKGWISFNAQCCAHNGETRDTRSRGGFLFSDDGSVVYHCFNCQYKASWRPGLHLGYKMRRLLSWMGMDDNQIRLLVFEAMRSLDKEIVEQEIRSKEISFPSIDLPEGAYVTDWQQYSLQDADFSAVKDFIKSRGFGLDDYQWYWSQQKNYRKKLIIPFTWDNKIVGYTARSIEKKSKLKYINHMPSDYVFGLDRQDKDNKFAIVCEGILDAIAVDGIAVLTNDVNQNKCEMIDSLAREIILVPDRDRSGGKLIDAALEYGWSVAFPDWDKEVKDCADANKLYGKLFTLKSILNSRYDNKLKIELIRRQHGI